MFIIFQKMRELREKVYEKVKPTQKRTNWIDIIMQGIIGATLIISIINYTKHLFH